MYTKFNVWSIISLKVIEKVYVILDRPSYIYILVGSIGYNLNVMRQSACLVINQITVDGYAVLLNCKPVNQASDSMIAPT